MAIPLLQLKNTNDLYPRGLRELATNYRASRGPIFLPVLPPYHTSYPAYYKFLKHTSDNVITLLKNRSMSPHAYKKKRPFR